MKKQPKRRYDIILIAALLVLALVLWLFLAAGKDQGSRLVVRVDGEEQAVYPLDKDGRYELNGGSNILIVQGGEAWLEDAVCPDKLCVRQGKIRLTGQVITCLPNKLTVTVEGEKGEVDIYLS